MFQKAPQSTCFNDTYDDYEDKGSKTDFNICRPSFKENLCNRIKRVQESSKILENVLDISSTLVKILCVCGIHECKANKALDVIIYAFMHFDEIAEHPGAKCKKRIRKEEFFNDLMRDCGMTKAEAKLTYSVVKCAFKAFYHKQIINRYDSAFVDECEWKSAAKRTINVIAQSGASQSEVQLIGRRILCAYENYLSRVYAKKANQQPRQQKSVPKQLSDGDGFFNNLYMQKSVNGKTSYSQNIYQCPMSPLSGELNCQLVSHQGCNRSHLICTDQFGRIFLTVDGNKVNYDPYVMECEARRAATKEYPYGSKPNKTEMLNIQRPRSDNGSKKLIAICEESEESKEKLSNTNRNRKLEPKTDDEDTYFTSTPYREKDNESVDKPKKNPGKRPKDKESEQKKSENKKSENKESEDKESEDKESEDKESKNKESEDKTAEEKKLNKIPNNEPTDKWPEKERPSDDWFEDKVPNDSPVAWIEDNNNNTLESEKTNKLRTDDKRPISNRLDMKQGLEAGNSGTSTPNVGHDFRNEKLEDELFITVKIEDERKGPTMEVNIQGYCVNNGSIPKNINTLRVVANKNVPLEFYCSPKN